MKSRAAVLCRFGIAALAAASLGVPFHAAGATTLPYVRVEQAVAPESSGGPVAATVPITLYSPATTPVTLTYATHDGVEGEISFGHPATGGVDYEPASGSLTFAPGEVQKNIKVRILPDSISDPNEYFWVSIDNVVGATVARRSGIVVIQDHLSDSPLNGSFAILDSQAKSRAKSYAATVTFVLTDKLDHAVTADYSETPIEAQAGVDYVAKTGTLTIPAGRLAATVSVKLIKRAPDNVRRKFSVVLDNIVGVAGQKTATGGVEIDGPAPS